MFSSANGSSVRLIGNKQPDRERDAGQKRAVHLAPYGARAVRFEQIRLAPYGSRTVPALGGQRYAFAVSTSFANAAGSLIASSLSILRLMEIFACFKPCMKVE